ncbi:Crp/Fnr family transcriptional regulator [Rheinheimera salexigens]|uniref:Crp/Fnr family transcriptional regulator n=1 Tax=Rheinheimera salexigens TaxID=1628148 RepID=UPI00114C8A44|nr:Crp/Fnr family transcriptional regulator [Rheinheimera salexigens]
MISRLYQPTPSQNYLLAAMSDEARQRIYPALERVVLPAKKDLYESEHKLGYVYFPTNSVVSILYSMGSGESAEIATVGNEGIIGVTVLMGSDDYTIRAQVHGEGNAYRLLSSVLKDEFSRNKQIQLVMLSYIQRLFFHVAQVALCNRYHTIEQQVCRCLLLFADRCPDRFLTLTQVQIAKLLGVRREGVTIAAGKLHQLGAISYHRGCISILDKNKLQQLGCDCYSVLKQRGA